MTSLFYSRWTSFLGLLFCIGLIVFAVYLQTYLGLLPCPLCVLQRILIALLGMVFLVGALYTPNERFGKRLHSSFIIVLGLLGMLVAVRHVWLTLQPAGVISNCSPTLEYMLQNLPLSQTFQLLLKGSGDCGRVTYRLLNLSIPQWTLIVFVVFLVFGIIRFMMAKNRMDG